jgi:hypothetical protein
MAASLYDPKKSLFDAYPKMRELSHEANTLMEGAEQTLCDRELAGCDTSWARDRLYEAEWRINCTNDYDRPFVPLSVWSRRSTARTHPTG